VAYSAQPADFTGCYEARLLMKGKIVVITGDTSGIGEVAAEALAHMGARIVLVARNKSRAEATLARVLLPVSRE
jgi:NAD(P)-dependent dehydrogenase (short-subunit alcohol dehydrogenase family)